MNRYRDFDAAWNEQSKVPITFRAKGEEFALPHSLPAVVVVKLLRLQKQHGEAEIPQTDLMELMLSILEEEQSNRLFAKGLTVDELGDLLKWIMEQYNAGEPEADVSKNEAGAADVEAAAS